MEYLLASTIGLGISHLLYRVFLKQEKTFKFNRFFLMGSLILCLIAPILHLELGHFPKIPTIKMEEVSSGFFQNDLPEEKTIEKLERKTNWVYPILLTFYFLISGLFLIRFARNLFKILTCLRNSEILEINRSKVIFIPQKTSPYSFFNFLFINKEDFKNQNFSEAIFQHERAHSDQFHSVDVIFMELLVCFLWFNPFFWLHKKRFWKTTSFLPMRV